MSFSFKKGSAKKQAETYKKQLIELKQSVSVLLETGEFANWYYDKEIPWAAMKEVQEVLDLIRD
jgi:hypothetical protein